jgi:hypothetical protein
MDEALDTKRTIPLKSAGERLGDIAGQHGKIVCFSLDSRWNGGRAADED